MASNTLIEGLDDNHKTGLLQVIIPAADALETVSVTTSNYDAEFGRSGGAITNVTIKSGTNNFKGSVFVFGNNEKTNAGDVLSTSKAPTKFLNTGFTLGGPIVKNKLFFFGDYQRTVDNSGYIVRATVPTALQRQGNFTEVTNGIYDPLTGAGQRNGSGRTAFPGNVIPPNRISPIAQKLIGFIPMPNIANAPFGQNNYTKAQMREKTTDGFDVKVNHTLNQRDQMSYRVSFMRPVVFDPGLHGEYGGPANGGFAGEGTNNSSSTAVTWTRVFSAKTVMDIRGGLNYYRNIDDDRATGCRPAPRSASRARTSTTSRAASRGSTSADTAIRAGPGLLGQPALGSLGEDLQRRRHDHPADDEAHAEVRRRVPPQHRHAAADAGRRRAARRISRSARTGRAIRLKRRRRRGRRTPLPRSCSTGRAACSAT